MTTKDIENRVYSCAAQLLHEKGYLSPVDLLVKMERLTLKQIEDWRFNRIPNLERVTIGNLSRLNKILSALRKYAQEQNLKPSITTYLSWGKGPKRQLSFSKTGSPYLERQYSTHYVLPKK
jgi:hypothetical protein